MKKLSKSDWFDEGFKVLSEFAQDRLRILYLCDRLKVTRGSFYHHFKSIGDYIEQLMEEWVTRNTLDVIRNSNRGKTAEEQMELLNRNVSKFNQSIESAIRSWGSYNQVVRKQLEKVDEIRINYTAGLFERMGDPANDAILKAKLEYATLIGVQMLFPSISDKELDDLYQFYKRD